MRKRSRAVTIRMNEDEYLMLADKLAETGLSQQAFIISAIHGAALIPPEGIEIQRELNRTYADLLRQLRGMATNINQMAKVANTTGALPTLAELKVIAGQIEQYRKEEEEQWRSIRLSMTGHINTEPYEM